MSDKKGNYPFPPSAPPPAAFDPNPSYIPNRPPPPSYAESQKSKFSTAPTPAPGPPSAPLYYSNNSPYPQMNNSYVHVPQYNQPIVPRVLNNNYANPSPYVGQHGGPLINKGTAPVVEFAAGARFNGKGSGSISVPPPPPGCAPNPAQMAAIQGRPVILKKKKNPFF